MNGKGDRNRSDPHAYRDGWERVFGTKWASININPVELGFFERVQRYFQDHPDEHPLPGPVSLEEMEPITLTKGDTKTDPGFEIDWIPVAPDRKDSDG